MRHLVLILYITLSTSYLLSQEIPQEIVDQVESYIDEDVEEADLLNQFERLLIYYDAPININKATFDDLFELGILTPVHINDILSHRAQYGDFLMIEELQSIPSLSADHIRVLSRFLKVTDVTKVNLSLLQMIANSRNELYLKTARVLEDKKGYIPNEEGETKYLGDPNRFFVRWRNTFSSNLRMGFTLEKDPGEPFGKETSLTGFDYLTFHAYLRNYNKTFKVIALGDYSVSMGQGLIAHNNFGGRKSVYVSNIRKGGPTIRPYNSVRENEFMRGAGLTLGLGEHVDFSVFASQNKRDGNLLEEIIDPENNIITQFSSFQISGNHRTESEIEDKNTIGFKSYGAVLKYSKPNFQVSVNSMANFFDGALNRSDQLYNLHRFRGDHLHNASVDFSYRFKNFNFFGESAYSMFDATDAQGGQVPTSFTDRQAHLLGALIGIDRKLSAAILYRNYGKSFNAVESNAFGESSNGNNENGLYMGLEYRISKEWSFRTYADFWRHPWVRFNISRPSYGREYVARLDYYKKRKLLIYAQYTYENKLQDYSSNSVIKSTGNQIRNRFRLHFDYKVSKSLNLRSRAEYSRFEDPVEVQHGYLIYQDFIYKPSNTNLSFTGRVALFDTDDYDSRIYAFENALLYEFAIPPYFDQGVRYYLNLRYKATRKMTIEFRYARTRFTRLEPIRDSGSIYFTEAISSGNEQILGNKRSEIRAQVRYVF